jgi:hypothetical protein
MMQSIKVELLHGLLEGGRRHTLAELRDPTGHDEAMLAELRRDATPAECVSGLIAALTLRIGEVEGPSMDRIRELTAGDRERLVLALCARLLGPEVDLIATCQSCGAVAEMPVRFADVAGASTQPGVTAESRVELAAGDARWVARLRPPVGTDLERAARDGLRAARDLIVSCIEELTDPSGHRVAQSELPTACESVVADALFALDPAAESLIEVDCPSCAKPIDALLDGYAILQCGLGGANRIYDDVFRIARAFHWSEHEILSLPLRRRRHYVAIAEASEARP